MLRIEHLTKSYDEKKAVDDLTLHIGAGEIFGFIGHNGAGKSTTLKSAVGILKYDEGKIPYRIESCFPQLHVLRIMVAEYCLFKITNDSTFPVFGSKAIVQHPIIINVDNRWQGVLQLTIQIPKPLEFVVGLSTLFVFDADLCLMSSKIQTYCNHIILIRLRVINCSFTFI